MDREFIEVVAGLLKIRPEALNEESTAGSIPEWDSLSHWQIIGELEDRYDVEFTLDEATDIRNLGDLYRILQKKRE